MIERRISICCAGTYCNYSNLELNSEFRCIECNNILHVLCGEWNVSLEKYRCKRCIAERNNGDSCISREPHCTTRDCTTPHSAGLNDTAQHCRALRVHALRCAAGPSAQGCNSTEPYSPAVNGTTPPSIALQCHKPLPTTLDNEINFKLRETIDRDGVFQKCLQYIDWTKLQNQQHRACVCVICDSFIIGVEKIEWLTEDKILVKEAQHSVEYLEKIGGKNCQLNYGINIKL